MTGWSIRGRAIAAAVAVTLGATACGGGKGADAPKNGVDLDGDPVALLPAEGIVLGQIDARAFYQSKGFGPEAARLVEQMMPIGEECGFSPSRDVDRVVLALYSTQGADSAAIVKGRFDDAKIAGAAASHTATKSGGALSTSTYLGHTVYLVGHAEFVVLTPKTALAGTESGVRRALERIHDDKTKRAFPQWMIDTIETKGAEVAFAADFDSQPIASAAVHGVPVAFLSGMHTARVIGNFKEPGMHVAATITYGDAGQAGSAAEQIRIVDGWTRALGGWLTIIPQVKDLDVTTQEKDVRCKAQVDDSSLRKLLGMVPGLLAKQ